MEFIPFKKEVLINSKDIASKFNKIRNITACSEVLNVTTTNSIQNTKILEGKVQSESFLVRRILPYGYSAFMLIVNGKIIDNRLILTYNFHKTISVFLIVILAFQLFISLNNTNFLNALITPVLFYIGIMVIYNIEIYLIKKILS